MNSPPEKWDRKVMDSVALVSRFTWCYVNTKTGLKKTRYSETVRLLTMLKDLNVDIHTTTFDSYEKPGAMRTRAFNQKLRIILLSIKDQ